MNSVILKFREYLALSSNTEKGIIQYVLSHPEEVAQMSIREFSKQVYASPSTITRLCHKIGFLKYREFQKALMYENALRKETINEENCEIQKDDTLEQLVDKIIYKTIVSLEDTKNLIDLEVLDKSVDLLLRANKLVFFGMGASLLVGKDAYLKFLRINKPCLSNEDLHSQIVQARNMTAGDVGIIISYSGMTPEMVECAEVMKNANVPVIAITCFHESPLSKLADLNLYITATEFEFRTGKLGSRIAQLAVIDMLYTAYVQRDYDNCMKILKKTYISKTDRKNTR
ncbi:MAG: MurR/RpiR family transcriptional regulator [Clostridiales bacterium]|nr:MurR/RpiR family transcriptional regulator [Clostridiales bacterium]